MDFFARQEAARRTTRWLLVAFLISVVLVVLAIDAVVVFLFGAAEPDTSPSAAVLGTSVVVLAIICGASLFKTLSLRAGGGAVARSLGGTRIERSTGDLALKRLHNVVEEMAIASGITMPEVYVLENEDGINAFAAGNSPADAAIAVTRGAATRLKREELQGVVAHEFSHILNGDMRLNLRLLGWTFGLLAVAIVARTVLNHSPSVSRGSRKDGAGALMLAALAVMLLGYIGVFFGRLLQAAVSRHRERLADASAVQFTRNPMGLSGALLKIAGTHSGSRLVTPEAEEVAHMLFAAGLPRLFATHPPIEERLKELDPSFKKENLPALAAEAARDAERQRAADTSPIPRPADDPGAAAFTPAPDRSVRGSAAHGIAALAGTMASENVRYAQSAREAVPEGLREFVQSADHARALVLVVLASKVPDVLTQQRRILENVYGAEFTARVLGMQALADSLPPALRLPAIQQLFPALRRLSLRERQQLRDVVAALANADERIDVFECCLTLLLASNLRDEMEAGPLHGSASLLQEIESIHTLFVILAIQGTGEDARARRAYEAGISVVLPEHRPPFREVAQWPKALGDSLARLTNLRPSAKRVLIEGLVHCIAHDQKLTVEEGELLRTVCAVLHCPLPPILAPQPAPGS
jgi:Zn-dependent protease with chaperone function